MNSLKNKKKKEKVSISHLGFIMLWELHYLLSSNISFNPWSHYTCTFHKWKNWGSERLLCLGHGLLEPRMIQAAWLQV